MNSPTPRQVSFCSEGIVSVKKTAETVGPTLVRAQRILITEGLIYHTTTMPVEVYIAMSDQQAEEEHGYRCIENAIPDSYRFT